MPITARIIPPRAPLVDLTTGKVTNEWFRFFSLLSNGSELSSNRFSETNTGYSPAGTTSLSGVMMGLATGSNPWLLTPQFTGAIRVSITGRMTNVVNGNITRCNLQYGTGTPPVNGAAQTGISFNAVPLESTAPLANQWNVFPSGAGASGLANGWTPFSYEGEADGLTIGAQYWFDLALSVSGGTGFIVINSVEIGEF